MTEEETILAAKAAFGGFKLWVYVIEDGFNYREIVAFGVAITEAAAYAAIYDYVKNYWDDDGPGREGEPIPADHKKAIDVYTNYRQSDIVGMYYSIGQREVEI